MDLHLDGGISREDYLSRRETNMQHRATLAAQIAKMKAEGTGRLEPLAAFINDARQAHYVAHHGDMRELRDFHRKNGSNLFLTERTKDIGALRAPLVRRRTLRNPTSHAQRVASVSETRRGGCAARAENAILTKSASFASFFVFGDSPATPPSEDGQAISVAALAENPSPQLAGQAVHLAGKSSPVLLAEFPSPWRIVAETPKSLGWWA